MVELIESRDGIPYFRKAIAAYTVAARGETTRHRLPYETRRKNEPDWCGDRLRRPRAGAAAGSARDAASSTWRSANRISIRRATSWKPRKRALDEGWTHYGPTQGYPDLREIDRIVRLPDAQICKVGRRTCAVVPGGKPIIFFPLMALIEAGDEVIYPNPGFPIYESMIRFMGASPCRCRWWRSAASPSIWTCCAAASRDKTKLVILNSPQNPTGGVIPEADIEAIAEAGSRPRHHGALRRDLLAHRLRQPAGLHRELPGHARKDHHPGRLFEDLRDDRLAHGLRRDAGVAGGRGEQADGELELLHGEFHAARGHRGADGPAGRTSRRWWPSSAAAATRSARG